MTVRFVAYIDESGDTGLEKIKPFDPKGASEWLVLSCFLVKEENDNKTLGWVREITSKFRNVQSPYLHFADLIPAKKQIACDLIATKPCRYFIVASNKKNINGYRNPNLDDGNKSWIYWWLTRLLLERVTEFCEQRVPPEQRGEQKLRIIFSRRGGLRYIDFERYMTRLHWQSTFGTLYIDTGDLSWSVIDSEEIFVLDHIKRAGLQLADIGAGAFFQALEQNRPSNCNTAYARALMPRLARSQKNSVLGYGFKTMPEPNKMMLAMEQREIFELCGYPKERW